jgi:hypothetical protein
VLDQVEERVDLVLVVAAAAQPRLAERDVVHVGGGEPATGQLGQRVGHLVQEVVDLGLVVSALGERRLAEPHRVYLGRGDPARRRLSSRLAGLSVRHGDLL